MKLVLHATHLCVHDEHLQPLCCEARTPTQAKELDIMDSESMFGHLLLPLDHRHHKHK